jgi:type III pantothenate kinase
MVCCQSIPVITETSLRDIFAQNDIKFSIISTVADLDTEIVDFLQSKSKMIHFSLQTKLPINILYRSKESLGLDRIANAVGSGAMFPNRNVLSIQAGTCLVFDFVNEKREYLGGSISPGLQMRFESLHEKTKNLPKINSINNSSGFLGTDTHGSISSGVINGLCYEIDGFIEDYKIKFNNLVVLFSGGDAIFLQKSIKNTIFAAQNVVLKGLNEIIKHNV